MIEESLYAKISLLNEDIKKWKALLFSNMHVSIEVRWSWLTGWKYSLTLLQEDYPYYFRQLVGTLLKLNCTHLVAMCISLKTFSGTRERSKWLRYRMSAQMLMISFKRTLVYKLTMSNELKNELLQSMGLF